RIRREIASEYDPGAAPIRLDIASERRHLEARTLCDERHRAVLDAGRHRLEPGSPAAPDRLLRQGGGGKVDIARRLAEQEVTHRAANDARLLAIAIERRQKAGQRGLSQETRDVASPVPGHLKRPGTRTPFSIC